MKQPTTTDIQRLEKKLNLVNDKLDRIMEVQGIELKKEPEEIDKEEKKKRKAKERQQAKILKEQSFRRRLDQMMEDRKLQYSEGLKLQKQFNLLLTPSASRIREFLRTNNPSAFDGLKRSS